MRTQLLILSFLFSFVYTLPLVNNEFKNPVKADKHYLDDLSVEVKFVREYTRNAIPTIVSNIYPIDVKKRGFFKDNKVSKQHISESRKSDNLKNKWQGARNKGKAPIKYEDVIKIKKPSVRVYAEGEASGSGTSPPNSKEPAGTKGPYSNEDKNFNDVIEKWRKSVHNSAHDPVPKEQFKHNPSPPEGGRSPGPASDSSVAPSESASNPPTSNHISGTPDNASSVSSSPPSDTVPDPSDSASSNATPNPPDNASSVSSSPPSDTVPSPPDSVYSDPSSPAPVDSPTTPVVAAADGAIVAADAGTDMAVETAAAATGVGVGVATGAFTAGTGIIIGAIPSCVRGVKDSDGDAGDKAKACFKQIGDDALSGFKAVLSGGSHDYDSGKP